MSLLKILILCHVALASSKLLILPNDADEQPCAIVSCGDNEMCALNTETNTAECIDQEQLQEFIKKHGLQQHHIGDGIQLNHKQQQHQHQHQQHKTKEEHAEHDFENKHHCTKSELHQMGGRLLKWFRDVHSTEAGNDRSLRSHKVACRAEVGWMFQQWDGNNDGLLTKSELKPIERGGNERCVEQFIDMCDDMIVDGSVSIDEWCDCFSFSDDLRHEPPCHKAKHDSDPHLLGIYLPRCDLEGFYKPEQCHEGECWCVDRYGREFDKSRVSNQLPDCGQYASDLSEEDVAFLKARI